MKGQGSKIRVMDCSVSIGCSEGQTLRSGGRDVSVKVDGELHCQAECPIIPPI